MSKTKVPASSVPGGSFVHGSQTAAFSLRPHRAKRGDTGQTGRGRTGRGGDRDGEGRAGSLALGYLFL